MELEQLRGINAFFQLPARSQTDPASISRSQQALATDAAKTAQPNLKQMQSQLRFQLDAIDEVSDFHILNVLRDRGTFIFTSLKLFLKDIENFGICNFKTV